MSIVVTVHGKQDDPNNTACSFCSELAAVIFWSDGYCGEHWDSYYAAAFSGDGVDFAASRRWRDEHRLARLQ